MQDRVENSFFNMLALASQLQLIKDARIFEYGRENVKDIF